jgi:hypothetical protein
LAIFQKINLILLISIFHSISFLFVGVYKSKLTASGDYNKSSLLQLVNVGISTMLTFIFFSYFKKYEWRIFILIFSDLFVIIYFFKKEILEIFSNIKFWKNDFISNFNYKFYFFIVLHGLFSFYYSNYDRIYIAKKISISVSGQYWYYLQLTLPILVLGEILVRYRIKDLYSNTFYTKLKSNKLQINFLCFVSVLALTSFFLTRKEIILIIIGGQLMNALYLPLSAILFSREKSNYILLFTILVSIIQFCAYSFLELDNIIIFAKIFFLLSLIRTLIYLIYIVNIYNNDDKPVI